MHFGIAPPLELGERDVRCAGFATRRRSDRTVAGAAPEHDHASENSLTRPLQNERERRQS